MRSEETKEDVGTLVLSAPRIGGIILFLFFLSGATGLIYEVVWTRMFTVVFGNTVFAVSTVLSAFMGGLALGSFYFGRLIDRRKDILKVYAWLEAGVGIFAFLVPLFLVGLNYFYIWLFQHFSYNFYFFSLIRFLGSFVLLLVPTTLMGGTLPVLSKFFIAKKTMLGKNIGNLYSVNTLGAVAGTFVAGFILIETLGVKESVYLAAIVNILVAVVVLVLNRAVNIKTSEKVANIPKPKTTIPPLAKLVLWGFFLSGFAALAYEVLWSRILLYLLGTSVHAFSIMLLTFLTGIALGSFLFGRWVDRIKYPVLLFSFLEIAIGIYGIFSIILLSNSVNMNEWIKNLFGIDTWWKWNLIRFGDAALMMFLPTILMGATFPVVSKIYTTSLKNLGSSIGKIYSFNTLGAVLGSFIAGFVLIPIIGTQKSILLVAAINLLVGGIILYYVPSFKFRLKIIVSTGLILIILSSTTLMPQDVFLGLFNWKEKGSEIIYCDEGISGTVTVHQYPIHKGILINGTMVAGTTFMLRTVQKLLGHIPLLLHPYPHHIMQVGFGTGETSRVVNLYGPERIDGVEISSEVVHANTFFTDINGNIIHEPNFNIIIMDGKNYALLTDNKYDLIMNDATHPAESGSACLYTVEYFRSCRKRLKPDGIMSSWVPLFGLKEDDFRMILKTFHTVFPHSTLWIGNNCINRHALLVGWKRDEAFKIDFSLLNKRLKDPKIKRDLEEIHLGDPFAILDCFTLDEKALDRFTRGARINTDDHPYLEFSAPKTLGIDELIWAKNLENASNYRTDPFFLLENIGNTEEEINTVKKKLARYFEGTKHIIRGQLFELRGAHQKARQEYQLAQKINPEDKDAKHLIESSISLAETWENKVKAQPHDIESRFKLAQVYLEERKYDQAIEQFEEILKLGAVKAEIYSNLGLAYMYKGEFETAINKFNKAIDLKPNFVWAHYNLGLAYAQGRKAWKEAIEIWKQALTIDPNYAPAHFDLGMVYLHLRELDAAIVELEKTILLRPQNIYARYNLGMAYAQNGRSGDAIEQLEKCMELTSDDRDGARIKAIIQQLQKQ